MKCSEFSAFGRDSGDSAQNQKCLTHPNGLLIKYVPTFWWSKCKTMIGLFLALHGVALFTAGYIFESKCKTMIGLFVDGHLKVKKLLNSTVD